MIAYIKGELAEKKEGIAVVDVQGVGYMLEISNQTLSELPESGQRVKLLVYHHFTENDQRLFGFIDEKEKNLFEKLITVKGIGPKLGLTILSGLPAATLIEAIVSANLSALSGISGIGKKTAERMVLELKDKLLDDAGSVLSIPQDKKSAGVLEEAVSALEALGFKKKDAEKAVYNLKGANNSESVSNVVKKALASLNR